jgi:hypothetical protein
MEECDAYQFCRCIDRNCSARHELDRYSLKVAVVVAASQGLATAILVISIISEIFREIRRYSVDGAGAGIGTPAMAEERMF